MHTSQLPSIATQQANRIKQLEAQNGRLIKSFTESDQHLSRALTVIAAARRSALTDPNGDLAKALAVYDAWLKELDK